jgi:hypothetical protein
MNPLTGLHLLGISVCLACLLSGPVHAREMSKGSLRDNFGRKIAVVVPPAPATPIASAASAFGAVFPSDGSTGSASSKHPTAEGRISLGSISVPSELSPQVQDALERGAEAAQGFSDLAIRRAKDLSCWLTTVWREISELPTITPNSPVMVPAPPPAAMRPISEPERQGSQLWFTNESRVKTVVTR